MPGWVVKGGERRGLVRIGWEPYKMLSKGCWKIDRREVFYFLYEVLWFLWVGIEWNDAEGTRKEKERNDVQEVAITMNWSYERENRWGKDLS